ncbi:Importin beta-like protein [Colletotrichum orbiculare MAFF 240422]|uniref:Importin beta-like protein n=1 Tax=Colletotrichum orbiculare (strain 104-T / ATCC 96160 / CBS 514.97 / LARS 414 / MAFF 240422) TaxID=1213857 RepID=A0A484G349_COLOR|nr:Importin beta-like protein [Colletotrichum orbiculare MAFF 240422]
MDDEIPSTTQQTEALILALYEPAPPETIARIQETLHRLQRAPSAWCIARDLLSYADDKVKFFGALTLIVKLNTERHNLVGWLIKSLTNGSSAMVIRKLCSALVTFFLYFPKQWELCIRHLCCSLCEGVPASQESVLSPVNFSGFLSDADPRKLHAAVWFCGTLVDEAAKVEMNSATHSGLYEILMLNVSDAMALMTSAFGCNESSFTSRNVDLRRDVIICLQSWVWFSQRVSSHSDELSASLRSLVHPTIAALADEGLYEVAAELLTDILSNYSGFLTEEHYESLFALLESQWSLERYSRLVEGDFDFDSVQFGQLMISLGDSRVQSLIYSVDDRSGRFLVRLRGLLSAQGYPVSDDKIFVPALEFWSTGRVNNLAESGIPTFSRTPWLGFGRSITGPPLISTFANLTLQSLSPSSWPDLEAAAFCLGSLADCVSGDAKCDDTLRDVFSSPLFEILQSPRQPMPGRIRQTCIALIERYSDFFERETSSLPSALNLLFSVLNDTLLSGAAARSIQRLCFSSRVTLASEVKAFLEQYQSIVVQSQLDCLACERIMGGIAAIIQAVPREDEKVAHLEKLFAFVKHDAAKCLISIGKGLQAPGDLPLDLDGEKNTAPAGVFPREWREAGPFVFPPHLVCDYLTRQSSHVPRIGYFVSTACSFLSSLEKLERNDAKAIRSRLLEWVINLLRQLPDPENDTELAQNGIEFTNRLVSREPTALLESKSLALAEFFFTYTLRVLNGHEPLPKAAAADFWATFMTLRNTDSGAQETIDHAVSHLGPFLAQSIIRNVGGNASRSELDRLSEPLKKMVSHHLNARAWLEQALFDPSFPSQQVSREAKLIFLKKVINLRGARGTTQVVREFWLASRGSKFAYAS